MWRIPLSDLNYDEAEQQAVLEVLGSRWLTMGPRTEEFEARLAEFLGVRHVIAVSNGTCALQLAYRAVAWLRGQAHSNAFVIVPDITFVATANAAFAERFTPYLCDIVDAETPGLSPQEAESVLEAKQVQAIALVHYAGFDCGAEYFAAVSKRHDAILIEDAAHAIGARTIDGRALGTIGEVGCFSFFSNKNLATGEGGAVVTNNDEIAERVRLWRCHGLSSSSTQRYAARSVGYDVLDVGYNFRCSEIVAALGIEQLKKLPAANARRRELYRRYIEALQNIDAVKIVWGDRPELLENSAAHILPLLCETPTLRDRIRAALHEAGIQTSHHYAPIHRFTWYRRAAEQQHVCVSKIRNATEFAQREITLPLYPALSDESVSEICSIIARVAKGRA
ncbi:MAG: DegT/DnrJ/EryC1/StrS aminotransferase family protein [Candidatus Sumerlaea chitinivorans]|nr:DegT/DnrJ/EryC1/StrS aminotransferase family protein [Candidatus Sumerlaea chitinivorans]